MILLDTQSVIWLNQEQHLLSGLAKAAIVQARLDGAALAISGITLWEFAMLGSRNRIQLNIPLAKALREVAANYTVLPVTPEVAEFSVSFSSKFPRDPSDRMIAATALAYNIPLVTSDQRIRRSGEVPTIW